eukprot:SAG11_NODE_624_length_8113_cov_9.987397_3_plen_218_part_00
MKWRSGGARPHRTPGCTIGARSLYQYISVLRLTEIDLFLATRRVRFEETQEKASEQSPRDYRTKAELSDSNAGVSDPDGQATAECAPGKEQDQEQEDPEEQHDEDQGEQTAAAGADDGSDDDVLGSLLGEEKEEIPAKAVSPPAKEKKQEPVAASAESEASTEVSGAPPSTSLPEVSDVPTAQSDVSPAEVEPPTPSEPPAKARKSISQVHGIRAML